MSEQTFVIVRKDGYIVHTKKRKEKILKIRRRRWLLWHGNVFSTYNSKIQNFPGIYTKEEFLQLLDRIKVTKKLKEELKRFLEEEIVIRKKKRKREEPTIRRSVFYEHERWSRLGRYYYHVPKCISVNSVREYETGKEYGISEFKNTMWLWMTESFTGDGRYDIVIIPNNVSDEKIIEFMANDDVSFEIFKKCIELGLLNKEAWKDIYTAIALCRGDS